MTLQLATRYGIALVKAKSATVQKQGFTLRLLGTIFIEIITWPIVDNSMN